MTVLGWIAVLALCGYVGLTAMIYLTQRSLMYFPETVPLTPAAGRPAASRGSAADHGRRRAHLRLARAAHDGKPVILYFHGNGGALHYRVERFRR